MGNSELKELYIQAASRARCNPSRTEEGEWKKAFEYADARDLSGAINAFFEKAGRSERGVWMPKVDELRPIVANARMQRESRSTTDQEHIAWECETCRGTVGGYFPVTRRAYAELRYCQRPSQRPGANLGEICGGNMAVVNRFTAESAA